MCSAAVVRLLKLLLLLAMASMGGSKTYQRLQPGMKMEKGDELVSTLGLYKIVMNDIDCSLNLYQFSSTSASYINFNRKFTPNNTAACSYLQVLDRSIVTNASVTFLSLSSSNLSRAYLIIDDTAILRFIGILNPSNAPSDGIQITIDSYSQSNKYVYMMDSHAAISDRVKTVTNQRNWIFQIASQTMTITNTKSQFSQSFSLPIVYFDLNGVFDANNQTLPGAIFNGGKLGSVCGGQKGQLYGPFVVQVSGYWPIVTVYDQQRYIIFQWSVLQTSPANPCPSHTFFLNDQCYSSCPAPYLHQIENSQGFCVLNCETGSMLDSSSRTCRCPNRANIVPPNYNCINNSSKSPLGCYCSNGSFFDHASYSCVNNCPKQLIGYLGVCLNCSKGCTQCSISFNGLYYLTCSQCSPGYLLNNGFCAPSGNCPPNCLICDSTATCTQCQPFYILSKGACMQSCTSGSAVVVQDLSGGCVGQNETGCGWECLKCASDGSCIVCLPGYALMVNPVSITCRKKNLLFSCKSKIYTSSFSSHVCYSATSDSLAKMNSCFETVPNCLLCHPFLASICILCSAQYLLQQNKCVSKCSSQYFSINQACLPSITNCQIHSFISSSSYQTTLTQQTITNNSFYLNFIRKGRQASNEPYGYGMYFGQDFMQRSDTISVVAELQSMERVCSQCQKGYGLTQDRKNCLPCPQSCIICLYASTCIAQTNEQAMALVSAAGGCQTFLSQDYSCLQSCPLGTFPAKNTTLQMIICQDSSSSSQNGYLRIDGSTYIISDNQYIHRFIFESPISISTTSRLLQQQNSTSSSLAIDANGNSITFSSSSPLQLLNLTGSMNSLSSENGQYPANSIYGISYQTSFRSYIKGWLAGIGYVLSIILILLHCVYVANGILYKMDNIIIFAQSLFFMLFNQILIANPVAQFYYGWSWTHLNFYPNYFTPDLYLSEPTIPPYALYNLDANVIRNAGSTLSVLLTFLLGWAGVSLGLWAAEAYWGRKQVWFWRISRDALIGAIQFLSYNILYWCMAFLNHDKSFSNSGTFVGLSVLMLTALIGYTLGRLYFHPLAGLYMLKRLLFACVLASSYEQVGLVGVMILLEVVFGVCRSLMERPREKWLLVSLWVEQGMLVVFWVILYATVNAAVVSILTTIFLYCWMLTFVADLADLYFNARNLHAEISCFRKIFEQPDQGETYGSSESEKNAQEKADTDRPFNSHLNVPH